MGGMSLHREMSGEEKVAVWRHVAPFVVWVVVMSLPLGNPPVRYVVQSSVALVALLICRTWRYYPPVKITRLPLGILVGTGVFILWVLPESPYARWIPGLSAWYQNYGIRDLGGSGGLKSPFAPEQCGWLLASIRLGGSAFVIPLAEEYFWRGFLMRWLKGAPFYGIEAKHVGWGVLVVSSVLFGLEHSRWLAGIMAGAAYGLLYIRTGDLWVAITAHVTTNYLLGLYVLATASYVFW